MRKRLEMAGVSLNCIPGGGLKIPVLMEILGRCADDTITEEQVQRVLEPVFKMIWEGKFDRPRILRRYTWLVKQMISVLAIAVLIIVVTLIQTAA